jgi:hypothetical protein
MLAGKVNVLEGLVMDPGGRVGGGHVQFERPGLAHEGCRLSCSVVHILAEGSSQGAMMDGK